MGEQETDRGTFKDDLLDGGIKGRIYQKERQGRTDYFYKVISAHFGRNNHTGIEEFIIDAIGLKSDGSYQKPAGCPTHHSFLDCLMDKRAPENFQMNSEYHSS